MIAAHLISDIHLEFADLTLPGGDLLVLAGDMAEARSFFRNDGGLARKQAERLKRFVADEMGRYGDVVYVAGNHEFYGRSVEEGRQLLRNVLPKHTHFLENNFVDLAGLTFWGATLWTDMNNDDPVTHAKLRHLMSDFEVIDDFSTHRAYVLHQESLQRLKTFLDSAPADPVVVVTHHAPSHLSVHPKYLHEHHMNGGYRSNLDQMIVTHPNIKLWCHGHMHDDSDYRIGQTRVVCHPRGYAGYEPTAVNYAPMVLEI